MKDPATEWDPQLQLELWDSMVHLNCKGAKPTCQQTHQTTQGKIEVVLGFQTGDVATYSAMEGKQIFYNRDVCYVGIFNTVFGRR